MPTLLTTCFIAFWFCLATAGSCLAGVQTVNLPISLDFPLLQSLITARAFPEKGEKATLVNELGGCLYLTLARPRVAESNGRIQLEVEVQARAGTPIAGNCFNSVEWQGFLVFLQQPYITKDNWRLAFNTVDTRLLGADRQPGRISSVLWEVMKPYILNYLNSLTIDLMPPVADLKGFLMPLFPHHVQDRTTAMLASMRPGPVTILPDHVRVDILADVEEVFDPEMAAVPEELTDEKLEQVIALWDSWDSMLSFLVTVLSQQVLTPEEQRTLIDVLLETRYRFTEGLASREIGQDFVRSQFVEAWQQLSPIFHNHLYKKAGSSHLLGYLAFVSSSDALMVLDRLGPTFGLEISRNGLIRLMQMLHADPGLLNYPQGVNPSLQRLFQLNLEQEEAEPAPEEDMPLINSIFGLLGPASACAAEQRTSMAEVLQWQVPSDNLETYIDRVNGVLGVAILKTERKELVPKGQQKMFKQLMQALAWQESCFRQFVTRDGKLTYLLSYNKSSVGLMQVNERVWRGIYERERLRWDIRYNSAVGCEIAAMYLTKYALRDSKAIQTLKQEDMAGLIYAMYNGGPSQYKKYLERLQNKKLYKSDKLFSQKYGFVLAKDTANLRKCLTGG